MWQQEYIPVAGSLVLSALAAGAPIFVLLLLLGVFRKPSWVAGLAGLATAIVVARPLLPVRVAAVAGLTLLRV